MSETASNSESRVSLDGFKFDDLNNPANKGKDIEIVDIDGIDGLNRLGEALVAGLRTEYETAHPGSTYVPIETIENTIPENRTGVKDGLGKRVHDGINARFDGSLSNVVVKIARIEDELSDIKPIGFSVEASLQREKRGVVGDYEGSFTMEARIPNPVEINPSQRDVNNPFSIDMTNDSYDATGKPEDLDPSVRRARTLEGFAKTHPAQGGAPGLKSQK